MSINENLIRFLRGSWGRGGKAIRNHGGDFWGPNRKRCSILRPEELKKLEKAGVIRMRGPHEFVVVSETAVA